MPITIPGTLKLSTKPTGEKPGALKTAIAAPGPLSVASTGSVDGDSVPLEASVLANRTAYYGYNWRPANAGEGASIANGAIVEGFLGCTQGGLVYIADDGTLTHTAPTNARPIGQAVRTTAIYFWVDPTPGTA